MSDPSERFRATLSSLLYFSPDGELAEEGSAPGETGLRSAGAQKGRPDRARVPSRGPQRLSAADSRRSRPARGSPSPPRWPPGAVRARRGWANVASDTIECESCGARVILKIPEKATRKKPRRSRRRCSRPLTRSTSESAPGKARRARCPSPGSHASQTRSSGKVRVGEIGSGARAISPRTTTVAAMLEGAGERGFTCIRSL